MFNSTALNIVIGLVFIYLLYSLLATILQEFISTIFSLRGRILKKGIRRMLDDGDDENGLTLFFYDHPLIKYLGQDKKNKPSYLSAQNFSKILIDLLRGEVTKPDTVIIKDLIQDALDKATTRWGIKQKTINEETLSFLRSIWVDAKGEVDTFKIMLEKWFDDTMGLLVY